MTGRQRNVTVCARCEHCVKRPHLACGITGRNVVEHAEAGDCPEGKHKKPADGTGNVARVPCIHKGDQIDSVPCKSCVGNVNVKVFACAVHGRCTVARRVHRDTPVCANCRDHKPVTTSIEKSAAK